jgi:hypothetical protein
MLAAENYVQEKCLMNISNEKNVFLGLRNHLLCFELVILGGNTRDILVAKYKGIFVVFWLSKSTFYVSNILISLLARLFKLQTTLFFLG